MLVCSLAVFPPGLLTGPSELLPVSSGDVGVTGVTGALVDGVVPGVGAVDPTFEGGAVEDDTVDDDTVDGDGTTVEALAEHPDEQGSFVAEHAATLPTRLANNPSFETKTLFTADTSLPNLLRASLNAATPYEDRNYRAQKRSNPPSAELYKRKRFDGAMPSKPCGSVDRELTVAVRREVQRVAVWAEPRVAFI